MPTRVLLCTAVALAACGGPTPRVQPVESVALDVAAPPPIDAAVVATPQDAAPISPPKPTFGRLVRIAMYSSRFEVRLDEAGRVWAGRNLTDPNDSRISYGFTRLNLDRAEQRLDVMAFSERVVNFTALVDPNQAGWLESLCVVLVSGAVECFRQPRGSGHAGTISRVPVIANAESIAIIADLRLCARLRGGGIRCFRGELANPGTWTPDLELERTYSSARARGMTKRAGAMIEKWRAAGGKVSSASDYTAGTHPESFRACALLADGAVECWGTFASGELGDGKIGRGTRRARPSKLPPAIDLAVAPDRVCAVLEDARVACWGRVRSAHERAHEAIPLPSGAVAKQLPMCPVDQRRTELQFQASLRMRRHAQLRHQIGGPPPRVPIYDFRKPCAFVDQGLVSTPFIVPGIDDAVSIAAFGSRICVVRHSGRLDCWGKLPH